MSRHRFTIVVDVDDDALAAHDEDQSPPPQAVEDWEGSDILTAQRLDIVTEVDIEWYDGITR